MIHYDFITTMMDVSYISLKIKNSIGGVMASLREVDHVFRPWASLLTLREKVSKLAIT
jgi:hypothetical protein